VLVTANAGAAGADAAALRMATASALRGALLAAGPVLLEPMMRVSVTTPQQFLGDVNGDLSRRRGQLQGMDAARDGLVVRGQVPLAEMFGYATLLRSMTQGRATYSMELSGYVPVPQVELAEAGGRRH
jgi:elongation factor G